MRYYLMILVLFTTQSVAQNLYGTDNSTYQRIYGQYGKHRTQPLQKQDATIIPRLDGGYTVVEPFGSTSVTPPDSMGRVRVIRNGVTTW